MAERQRRSRRRPRVLDTSRGDHPLGHDLGGVSAQIIGVEGGPVAVKVDVPGAEAAGKGLKTIDPARYGSLNHPGDAYAYDIYTQVARAVRVGALAQVKPSHAVAVGESQSAFALVTYINGVQPLTKAIDGFFVHSRGAAGLPVPEAGKGADISSSIGGIPTIFRTNTEVPILDIQTETDVVGLLGSARARQPDTDLVRLWEVPGTAHADLHLTGHSGGDRLRAADQRRPVPHRRKGRVPPLPQLGRRR